MKMCRMDMDEILEGNKAYSEKADKRLLERLAEAGQKPVATVVSCSDSRVPVEVVFNQTDPGRFFVVRVAGNVVADASVRGSIEYAVEHLKTPYVIVLGHTKCGAVKAYLDGVTEGDIGELVGYMRLKSSDLHKAVAENVESQVRNILRLDYIKHAIGKNELEVYGMLYDISNGKVQVLSRYGRLL